MVSSPRTHTSQIPTCYRAFHSRTRYDRTLPWPCKGVLRSVCAASSVAMVWLVMSRDQHHPLSLFRFGIYELHDHINKLNWGRRVRICMQMRPPVSTADVVRLLVIGWGKRIDIDIGGMFGGRQLIKCRRSLTFLLDEYRVQWKMRVHRASNHRVTVKHALDPCPQVKF